MTIYLFSFSVTESDSTMSIPIHFQDSPTGMECNSLFFCGLPETDMPYKFAHALYNLYKLFSNNTLIISLGLYFLDLNIFL